MTHDGSDALTRQLGVEDAPPDVLYWAGMYFIKKCTSNVNSKQKYDKSGGLELPQDTDLNVLTKAKDLFIRAVQRMDCVPHPLSLHMLGWIEEHYNCFTEATGAGAGTSESMVNLAAYRQHLAVAERYYVYALQLDPIDPIMFIKLYRQIHDTLCYVRGLTRIAEHNERELNKRAARAESTELSKKKKKKKKIAVSMSQNGNSLKHASGANASAKDSGSNDVNAANEQAHQLIYELANVMRQRLLLHERVYKLAQLRAGKLSKHINGLLNNNICGQKSESNKDSSKITMGKFLHVEPFWLEKLFHVFSFEGDDWTWLLKSSKSHQNRHHQTNQNHASSK